MTVWCDVCGREMEYIGDDEWRCRCGNARLLIEAEFEPRPGLKGIRCLCWERTLYVPSWMPVRICGHCGGEIQIVEHVARG